jgi:GNAT superfamily N-acetyltransferase
MPAYRFCRTDDIGLLVDALNRCWAPHFPGEPAMTPAAFKRSIRDLQVWCSSCMVAFSGSDPIGVLIGAKRATGTLVHRIAVHPDHLRQGHGRHLLTSLASKLAILGPPRIVAETPDTFAAAHGLFSACGYVEEARLTDYVSDSVENATAAQRSRPAQSARGSAARVEGPALSERSSAARVEGFVIPITVDDLAANGLLDERREQVCWERSVETLTARKDEIAGLAVASDERIEAYVLYISSGAVPNGSGEAAPRPGDAATEIVSLRTLVEDGGAHLTHLLSRLGTGTFRFAKVHPAEMPKELLETLGFRPAAAHRLCATRARAD